MDRRVSHNYEPEKIGPPYEIKPKPPGKNRERYPDPVIGVIITSHYLSSRFVGKCICPIDGIPLLGRIIQTFKAIKGIDHVIACIPDIPEDNILELIARHYDGEVWRGPEFDVFHRHYYCIKHYNLTHVIGAGGDCWWYIPDMIRDLVSAIQEQRAYNHYSWKSAQSFQRFPGFEFLLAAHNTNSLEEMKEIVDKNQINTAKLQEQYEPWIAEITDWEDPCADEHNIYFMNADKYLRPGTTPIKTSIDYPYEMAIANKAIKELGHVPRDYEELQMIYRTISKI